MALSDSAIELPTHPYIKPWYRLSHGDGKVVFEYAGTAVVFEGRATERLLPSLLALLDGTHSVDDIEGRLGRAVAPAVRNALHLLARNNLLSEGPPLVLDEVRPVKETAHFLAAVMGTASVTETRAQLERSAITVLGDGSVASELHRTLQLSGVRVGRSTWEDAFGSDEFVVAAPSREELPQLESWNHGALASRRPWLQALPFDGRFAAVGPLFVPHETCCYECYRLRRQAASGYPEEVDLLERAPAPSPTPPPLDAVIAGLAAMLAIRWLVVRDEIATGTLFALEGGPTLSLAGHWVYRVPRCSACSAVSTSAPPLPWYKEVAA